MHRLLHPLYPHSHFPNNILTPLLPHPNLMNPLGIHINSSTHPKSFLPGSRLRRVRDGHLAPPDEVRREAAMGMGRVVGLPGHVTSSQPEWWRLVGASYGPSLQVKTCEKPHDRTRDSDWERVGGGIVLLFLLGKKGKSKKKKTTNEIGFRHLWGNVGMICAETGTRTPTSSMGSSNSTLELFQR